MKELNFVVSIFESLDNGSKAPIAMHPTALTRTQMVDRGFSRQQAMEYNTYQTERINARNTNQSNEHEIAVAKTKKILGL